MPKDNNRSTDNQLQDKLIDHLIRNAPKDVFASFNTNPEQIRILLNSPIGNRYKQMVFGNMIEMRTMQELQKIKRFRSQDKHLEKLYALLGLIYKNKLEKKQEFIEYRRLQEMANQSLDNSTTKESDKIVHFVPAEILNNNMQSAINALDVMADENSQEIEELLQEEQDINSQYERYMKSVDRFDNTIDEELEAIAEENIGNQEKIFAQQKDHLQTRMNFLHVMLEMGNKNIAKSINENDHQSANEKITEAHSHNLNLSWLDERLAILRGEKQGYGFNPQTNEFGPVEPPHTPQFTLTKDKQILSVDGEYYLLNKGQTFENIKDNEHEKKAAKQAFLELAPQITTVKSLLLENKKQAKELINSRQNLLTEEIDLIKRQRATLTSEQRSIASERLEESSHDSSNLQLPQLQKMSAPRAMPGKGLGPSMVLNSIFYNKLVKDVLKVVEHGTISKQHQDSLINQVNLIRNETQQQSKMHPKYAAYFRNIDNEMEQISSGLGMFVPGQPIPTMKLSRLLESFNRFTTDANLKGIFGLTQIEERLEAILDKLFRQDAVADKKYATQDTINDREYAYEESQNVDTEVNSIIKEVENTLDNDTAPVHQQVSEEVKENTPSAPTPFNTQLKMTR